MSSDPRPIRMNLRVDKPQPSSSKLVTRKKVLLAYAQTVYKQSRNRYRAYFSSAGFCILLLITAFFAHLTTPASESPSPLRQNGLGLGQLTGSTGAQVAMGALAVLFFRGGAKLRQDAESQRMRLTFVQDLTEDSKCSISQFRDLLFANEGGSGRIQATRRKSTKKSAKKAKGKGKPGKKQ